MFYLDIFVLLVETGRSNFWKITLFLLVETDVVASGNLFFFLPFWDTSAAANFSSVKWKRILNSFPLVERDFLASGNTYHFFIFASDLCRYQTVTPVFFSSCGNAVLRRILHSSQWKRIFWLMETSLFQYLKYPFIGSSFFTSCFLRYSCRWKQLFHVVETYLFDELTNPSFW